MSSTAPSTTRLSTASPITAASPPWAAPSASNRQVSAPPTLAPATPPFPVSRRGIRTVPLRGGRWRVTREAGEVLGYVDLLDAESGREPRWRASRMPARHAALRTLGDFPSADDALDVIRLG